MTVTFVTIFRRFSTTFRRFPKIFQNLPEDQTHVSEHFPNVFQRLPKTSEEDPKMFRSYTNKFKCIERDKNVIKNDIFTCEDIITSRVRISYPFYQFVTSQYTTNF